MSAASRILLTSDDLENIEKQIAAINSEILSLEARLPELQRQKSELTERLKTINALLEALGLRSIDELASNSLYAARHPMVIPRTTDARIS